MKEAILKALEGVVSPDQVAEVKETAGKVLITLAASVPMGEKPAFADKVKTAARSVKGVKDVFVSFAAAPESAAPQAPPGPQPLQAVNRILAVGAGKGGVGKSTVAVNLAVALANAGHKVGLLDADIYGPSAAIMTGSANHKAQGDAQQRVIPPVCHGVRVISVAFLLPEEQSAVVWRGPMVGKMVQQLLTGVAWGALDYLVVDLPPGTGDAVLSLVQTVPLNGAIVVTTPQDVALLDVLKAVEMFHAVKVPVIGVIENMSGFTCPKCGEVTDIFLTGAGERAAKQYNIPLLGTLPLDPAVPPGGDSGNPIVVEHPDSIVSKTFAAIAKAATERMDELGATPLQVDLKWSSGV